eukprot:m.14712 g.14712  ORF g.14712 m.14712 type:complete len:60 (+) comp10332_c0_seq2:401-580(+)
MPSQPSLLLSNANPLSRRANDCLLLLRVLQPQMERRQLTLLRALNACLLAIVYEAKPLE